jgi:serpin B
MHLYSPTALLALSIALVLPFTLAHANGTSSLPAVVEGNTEFAIELYGKVREAEGNVFLSPYSISTALAMTSAGARGNTAQQMAKTLRFSSSNEELHAAFAELEAQLGTIQKKGNVALHAANSLWPQEDYPFLPEYLALLEKYYGVAVTPVNYKTEAEEARAIINGWVDQKTNKAIRNLIGPGVLDSLTRLVLANAIYFKGNWARQFKEASTKDAPFYLTREKAVQAPLMTQQEEFGYTESEDLQALELPYVDGDLSMLVLLPREVDGLQEIEKALTVDSLKKWTDRLPKREVRVFLPRFTFTSQFRLEETLTAMGMPDAFDPNKADFSGMDGRRGWLFIGAVIHKAFVDVNEEGTEAAASTAVAIGLTSAPGAQPPIFRADHPFLFLIRDNHTGSILFIGRLADPTASGE